MWSDYGHMATEANILEHGSEPSSDGAPARCVIVIDDSLPPGLAANAAAVLAVTLGARAPGLLGGDVDDADGAHHPGLIDRGLPILKGPASDLGALRARALEAGVEVIGVPRFGQETTDYGEFRDRLAETPTAELDYLGLLLSGPKRAVNKLTGSLPLLR
jgi:hypothetical protein